MMSHLGDIPIACYGHFDRTAIKQASYNAGIQEIQDGWINLQSVVRRT
jgi:hypothetical protein